MHDSTTTGRPSSARSPRRFQGPGMFKWFKQMFCHHQWSPSRSRPGTVVCYRCMARRAD